MNHRLRRNCAARALAWALIVLPVMRGVETQAVTIQEFLAKRGYTAIPLQSSVVRAEVPSQVAEANHLFASAKVNGRTAVAIVDTGATVLSIDTGIATGMKRVLKLPEKISGLFGASKAPGVAVLIEKLEIGAVSYAAEPAALLNLRGKQVTFTDSLIPRSGHVKQHDLVLGWEFLSRHHAVIDYQGPTLFLHESEPPEDFANTLGRSLRAGGFVLVPLTSRNLEIEVAAVINDHPALLILDTGGFVTVLDNNQRGALGVNVRQKVMELVDIGGKRRDLNFTRIQTLHIGDFRSEKLAVGVTDLQPLNERRAHADKPPVQGILGPEVLDSGRAIIDCANLRLYLSGK